MLPAHVVEHVTREDEIIADEGGTNSTLSDRHQLDEPPAPHNVQNEAIDVPEPRYAKSWSYADSTRSASFPTDGNKIMTRFGTVGWEELSTMNLTCSCLVP
jgi:hypothetical protein